MGLAWEVVGFLVASIAEVEAVVSDWIVQAAWVEVWEEAKVVVAPAAVMAPVALVEALELVFLVALEA